MSRPPGVFGLRDYPLHLLESQHTHRTRDHHNDILEFISDITDLNSFNFPFETILIYCYGFHLPLFPKL